MVQQSHCYIVVLFLMNEFLTIRVLKFPNLQTNFACIKDIEVTNQLKCVLCQVDLAGSENVGRSGAVDKRLREAGTDNLYISISAIYCEQSHFFHGL